MCCVPLISFQLKRRCALMHRQWRTSKTSLMKKLFSTWGKPWSFPISFSNQWNAWSICTQQNTPGNIRIAASSSIDDSIAFSWCLCLDQLIIRSHPSISLLRSCPQYRRAGNNSINHPKHSHRHGKITTNNLNMQVFHNIFQHNPSKTIVFGNIYT